jgi:hypothetical protein
MALQLAERVEELRVLSALSQAPGALSQPAR